MHAFVFFQFTYNTFLFSSESVFFCKDKFYKTKGRKICWNIILNEYISCVTRGQLSHVILLDIEIFSVTQDHFIYIVYIVFSVIIKVDFHIKVGFHLKVGFHIKVGFH